MVMYIEILNLRMYYYYQQKFMKLN